MSLKPMKTWNKTVVRAWILFAVFTTIYGNPSVRIGVEAQARTGKHASIENSLKTNQVLPVPDAIRNEFELGPFYQKYVDVGGLPVVGSANVSDFAILEAAWILRHMLGERVDIFRVMADKNVHVVVMAWNEFTTDVPEHSRLKPKVYWDRRARGLGGSPVSCAEENMLCFPEDPYFKENILIHEFAHAVHHITLREIDPTFDQRLKAAYEKAKERGLYPGTYAITNRSEYWAEGVQNWFDNNRQNDALHCHVNTRAELKEYDPELTKLCAEVLGDGPWRYRKPMDRDPSGRAHLVGWDPAKAPHFRWRQAPLTEKPRVLIQTAIGDIEVELDAKRAPVTTKDFLRYVLEGFYSDGEFFRTVTASNQPDDPVKITVIQARADPSRKKEAFEPVAIERTNDTGLRHLDGTIFMARKGPDTATYHFFICVGDQPEPDFSGKRNSDGQNYAAFGRVIKGMDIVRKIHTSSADGQTLKPPIRIQRAIRVH